MTKKHRKSSMICPCCGHARAAEMRICDACGARQVGEPLSAPEVVLPSLGASFAALGCALVILLFFIAMWLLGNDMKVARTLLVWAVGDATQWTRGLLQADPNLRYYRVFSYDAYRMAFFLSFGLIPLSLLGVWMARRALGLVRRDPARFGGRPLARAAFALSMLLFLAFSAVAISSIPTALEQGRAKHAAATRARMYQLQQALTRYYRENGTYPSDLSELQSASGEMLPQLDYWEQAITYSTASLIAAKDGPPGFSNYRLVSAGPDGLLGTADDIVMDDDVIVTAPTETDLPTSLLAPERPGK